MARRPTFVRRLGGSMDLDVKVAEVIFVRDGADPRDTAGAKQNSSVARPGAAACAPPKRRTRLEERSKMHTARP